MADAGGESPGEFLGARANEILERFLVRDKNIDELTLHRRRRASQIVERDRPQFLGTFEVAHGRPRNLHALCQLVAAHADDPPHLGNPPTTRLDKVPEALDLAQFPIDLFAP